MEKVTLLCTSCGRFDLLRRTIMSFFLLNNYPIEEFIINEDSGTMPEEMVEFLHSCHPKVTIFYSSKAGQVKSLDKLYNAAKTEYIFTTEDDWLYTGNPNFIQDSMDIMQDKSVHHVWVRKPNDHKHPLKPAAAINGVLCQEVTKGYFTHWGGFSHNPGLKRISDYRSMFPNGFVAIGDEKLCSKHVNTMRYKAVSLVDSACHHIGWHRHTPDFKI